MKNSFKAMTAGLVMATALTVSAAAADFTHCADHLNQMGLFQGSTNGYELDRTPTRAEAATMLVRLLGKEAEAKTLTYAAPFTDLEDWQKPYVQYLYENHLTNGATETTFDPESKCDAQMYSTFLLRTLGYSDAEKGDFTYAEAIEKATEIGVADVKDYATESNFLRDDMVAMSYTALSVEPKDQSEKNLLSELVKNEAVDKNKAQATLDLFDNYNIYAAAVQANQTKVVMDVDANVSVKSDDIKIMTAKMAMNIKTDMNIIDLNKSKIAMTGKLSATLDKALVGADTDTSMEQNIQYYYTDGNYYMQMDDQKFKMPMDFSEVQSMIANTQNMQREPISAIKTLTKSGNAYTVEYAPGVMNNMINSMLNSMNMDSMLEDESFKMHVVKASVTVKDGKMSGMDMDMGMTIAADGESLDMTMNVQTKITETGNSVKVELPKDLDTYVDIIGAADTTVQDN